MTWRTVLALSLMLVAGGGVVAFWPGEQAQALPARDLKFFDKEITQAKLYREMRGISKDLGVKCNFCHVMAPRKQFHKSTPNKEIALKMLFLTDGINKDLQKIFPAKKQLTITCYTCHRGKKDPVLERAEDEDEDEDE